MHCDTFKTIQMWLFTFTNSKVFLKKKNNKQTKRWTGHGLIVIRGKVKTIKLRERNDKTRKTAAALADILNTRDTVSVIWRRRQQISEDDFQANPQELWSWVRRLNFPRVCQKRGQKRRCKNFLVFPVKKKTYRTAVPRWKVQNVSLDSIKVQWFLEWEQSTFMIE